MGAFLEKESPFEFDELFFSRTDSRGVIQSGNSVFQRVSKYGWDELLKRPHSLIRHPAMPRAVFHLLWETIRAGRPIGAYIVNRAKDGAYYWVFALVTPIEGGFLSIRLKPSAPLFEAVKSKYAALLEVEGNRNLAPKDSQILLLEEVGGLGFRDYRQFMTEALIGELECRRIRLGLEPIRVISQLREVLRLGTRLRKKCDEIFAAYRSSALVPFNLEAQAARIGPEAAAIAVISGHYDGLARQIQAETRKFLRAGSLVQEKAEACQFDVCNSLLQKEMFLYFRNETKPTPIRKETEMEHLEVLGRLGLDQAKASLGQIDREFTEFKSVYREVQKLSAALEIVSMTGRIEAAKIRHASGELKDLITELSGFKTSLRESLKEIDAIGDDLLMRTHEMRAGLA